MIKPDTPAQKKSASPKRVYNNQSRLQKTESSRKTIIETFVHLLVERKGGVVTFEEIAKASKVSLRSIYRLFRDKETLQAAMDDYLLSYLADKGVEFNKMNVAQFADHAFKLFDKNEKLMMAYLYSPFGHQTRLHFRKKLSVVMTAKILEEKSIPVDNEIQKKMAVIVTLINAKIWHDIRQDYGYSGEEMSSTIQWAIETLVREL